MFTRETIEDENQGEMEKLGTCGLKKEMSFLGFCLPSTAKNLNRRHQQPERMRTGGSKDSAINLHSP